jgi:hypothetical protein
VSKQNDGLKGDFPAWVGSVPGPVPEDARGSRHDKIKNWELPPVIDALSDIEMMLYALSAPPTQ